MAYLQILLFSIVVVLCFIIVGPWYEQYHYFYQIWMDKYLMYLVYLSVFYFLIISTLVPPILFSVCLIYLILELAKLEMVLEDLCNLHQSETNAYQITINKTLKYCLKRLLFVKQLVEFEK